MDRLIDRKWAPAIERGFGLIPKALRDRINPHFLVGVDPLFAGLHDFVDASYGRSYRDTCHCAYPWHQTPLAKSQRHTTVVLNGEPDVDTVVHELGHVVHESLGFDHRAVPLSGYAQTNHHEAFAVAFTAWLIPDHWSTVGIQDKTTNDFLGALL